MPPTVLGRKKAQPAFGKKVAVVRSDLERNVADTEARLKNDIRQKQRPGSATLAFLILSHTQMSHHQNPANWERTTPSRFLAPGFDDSNATRLPVLWLRLFFAAEARGLREDWSRGAAGDGSLCASAMHTQQVTPEPDIDQYAPPKSTGHFSPISCRKATSFPICPPLFLHLFPLFPIYFYFSGGFPGPTGASLKGPMAPRRSCAARKPRGAWEPWTCAALSLAQPLPPVDLRGFGREFVSLRVGREFFFGCFCRILSCYLNSIFPLSLVVVVFFSIPRHVPQGSFGTRPCHAFCRDTSMTCIQRVGPKALKAAKPPGTYIVKLLSSLKTLEFKAGALWHPHVSCT